MSNTSGGPAGGWRRFALAAYGPTTLSSVGHGAIAPLVALSALDLGASIEVAALVTGLAGVGQLLGDLPASWVATRLGDKKAIVAACLWDAACLALAFAADSLPLLCVAVFCFGPAGSVLGLARQSYITEAVPILFRARALSTLGGAFRVGAFVGPLAGAAVVARWDLSAAYGFAAGMSVVAAVVTLTMPDLPEAGAQAARDVGATRLWRVLRTHRRVLATLGSGVLLLALTRSVRQAILPLWCESIGLSAAQTSLVFAVSMAVDMSLFFVGGSIMDRFGRLWVALPSMIVLGVGLVALSFAHRPALVVVAAVVLGLGNGVGSGLVMVLGSDASPDVGRAQFLSGWRLMSDVGNSLGPVAIGAIVKATASLGVAAMALGAVAFAGAFWLAHGIRRHPPTR
ncbi:MAG: MFS transporter [Propionibacteriaceae bacterium]|jgi:MFS family permease|nr:MFS transporter [Propionibacteriaceae bacterium]